MAFTALNLLLCTVRRVKPLTRQALYPQKEQSAEAIARMPVKEKVVLAENLPAEKVLALVADAFHRSGLKTEITTGTHGKTVFAQKGVLGFFGSLLSHTGLLIILVGAMYGALTGFELQGGGIAGIVFRAGCNLLSGLWMCGWNTRKILLYGRVFIVMS